MQPPAAPPQSLKKEARGGRRVPSLVAVSETMNKSSKKDSRTKTPQDKKRVKTFEQPSPPIQEEPEPVSSVLQGDEIQALAIKVEDLEKLHTPRLPQEGEKTPVARKFIIRRHKPQEAGKKAQLLVAYPADTDASKRPLSYSGPEGPFVDNCEQILPHNILGSLQEFKREALARGNAELAELITDSHLDGTVAALEKYREKNGDGKRRKCLWAPPSQHRALQNWHHNVALRKKQQRVLSKFLQKPENELLMNLSEDYRRVQEERYLIDRSLPALHYGKGYRVGSEFWSQPECIGDELTGLMMTLTQRERGYPEPITHVGKPQSVKMEMGSRSAKESPFRLTWDKSLFLRYRRQELKSVLEELDFNHPDLDGLEVIGKGQPFTSVSAQYFQLCQENKEGTIEERVSVDPLEDYPDVVPEPVLGPSLQFCGQPARWINSTTSHRDEIGIAARVTFEVLAGEKAESCLTVSNDGTAAIWYDWRRQAQPVTFEETKEKGMQYFYFNTRPGVILPGETRNFSFFFKSGKAGIFSESWEFGTHPMLLGGAVLQVSLWGIAVYEDKLAGLRDELESELAAREVAVIVKENLKELLDRIRTPERVLSPVDAYITEEELFHRKNPELHYQHQVVKELHELWRQHMNFPSTSEEEEISRQKSVVQPVSGQKSTVQEIWCRKSAMDVAFQKSIPGEIPQLKNTREEIPCQKSIVEEILSQMINVEEEEVSQTEWNLSFEDFKQALQLIPEEEKREAALTQLNKAALALCVEQRPTQSDLLYQTCLQLWREAVDGLVSRSLMLRSLLSMPEKDTSVEIIPEEIVDLKQIVKGGKEDRKTLQKEEKKTAGGKEKEDKKGAIKSTGKDREERSNSRKTKGKDEKRVRTPSFTREVKEFTPLEGIDSDQVDSRQEPVDPIVLEKYREKLYVEVYGLLESMVGNMVFLFEELKRDAKEQESEAFSV
ncbi:MYCBP-associated protein isoform X1 [Gopherus evgoodei]|uniref:MYCBP-associated protein isoform X1 n=1 Tax=Gopherus evgoodei TaxID=1825980 RepID=UPI0011CF758F|nr:MYCBP-associated protein isoform X1 [Gopherus evgoodei]